MQNAFLAISAWLKNMEEATKANHEHLLVATITQRMEQFSPLKQRPVAAPCLTLDNLPPPSQFLPAEYFTMSTHFNHPMYLPLPPQYLVALCTVSQPSSTLPPAPHQVMMTLPSSLLPCTPETPQMLAITLPRSLISQSLPFYSPPPTSSV